MSDCRVTRLTDRGVVRIAGADAATFLQGLITNDVERVAAGTAIHAGLLTPQGKILFDFHVTDGGDGAFLLECAADMVGDLVKRLTFYKLRADVEIVDVSESHSVWAAWDGPPEPGDGIIRYPDPRLEALGIRLIAPAGDAPPLAGCKAVPEAAYHAHRIALAVPEGGRDYVFGDTFPHEADFDQLGGVDFAKGCYVGQEVVSRMSHRGTARKRVVPVEGAGALAAPGSDITAGGAPIGTLGSVAERSGLALLRLDRAEKALGDGKTLEAGGVALELRQPAWADFRVPVKE